MATETYTPVTLFHPTIPDVIHVCESADEQTAWANQGWLTEEELKQRPQAPDVTVEVVHKTPAKAKV
ncbi:hypothetical protein ACN08Y_10255 [Rothia sp. P5764]|uniref:hypothetical protein n=1 Tax=Rothia sp. P5764 TaxID=3402654 RepID=UPI003AC0CBD6